MIHWHDTREHLYSDDHNAVVFLRKQRKSEIRYHDQTHFSRNMSSAGYRSLQILPQWPALRCSHPADSCSLHQVPGPPCVDLPTLRLPVRGHTREPLDPIGHIFKTYKGFRPIYIFRSLGRSLMKANVQQWTIFDCYSAKNGNDDIYGKVVVSVSKNIYWSQCVLNRHPYCKWHYFVIIAMKRCLYNVIATFKYGTCMVYT